MQKITVSLSANTTNGSNNLACLVSIEEDITDALSKEMLQEKITSYIDSATNSVSPKFKNIAIESKSVTIPPVTYKAITSNGSYKNSCKDQSPKPVSEKQLECLNNGALRKNMSLDEYLMQYGCKQSELTAKNAGSIIQKSIEASKR